MKSKLTKLTLTAILGIAVTTSAFAVNESTHLSDQTPSAQSQTSWQATPLGYAVSGSADRIVNIDSGTKYLNVEQNETVQINLGGKVLTWKFDTSGTPTFSLSKIFHGVDGVTVYVSGNPDDFS